MNMRLTNDLEAQINKRKKELEILNAAFELIGKNGSSTNTEEVKVKKKYTKRNTTLGTKRGPYKKRKKGKISRAFKKRLQSPDWKVEIPKALSNINTPLTCREITEIIAPRVHARTKNVFLGRSSAYISNVLIPKGIVKEAGKKDNSITYSLT